MENAPFAYVNIFSPHANPGFFYGADLPDPFGLLEGTGKRMRHIKLRSGSEPDEKEILALIDTSSHDIKQRLQVE